MFGLISNQSSCCRKTMNGLYEVIDGLQVVRRVRPAALKNGNDLGRGHSSALARTANPVTHRHHARRLLNEMLKSSFRKNLLQRFNAFTKRSLIQARRVAARKTQEAASNRVPQIRPLGAVLTPQFDR